MVVSEEQIPKMLDLGGFQFCFIPFHIHTPTFSREVRMSKSEFFHFFLYFFFLLMLFFVCLFFGFLFVCLFYGHTFGIWKFPGKGDL